MTNTEKKANELIESFYLCMPFKDVKLTACAERPDLIIKMEKLSAKQCAIIAVDEILANINATIFYHKESIALPFNKEYWLEVRSALNGL
jgi:hypothetical protein